MIIIITIVVLILCVSTRRKRNNTGKTPHYSTTTQTRNTSSGGPTGDYDDEPQVKAALQHTAHTTTSFSVYDDIDIKPDKRNYIEQFADPMYEDMKKRKGKKTAYSSSRSDPKGEDEVPSIDPSDLYAMPNKIKKKKLQEVDNSDQLYAQPDKTKKKGKKETSEEQEKEDVLQYEPSADSEEEEVPQIPLFDPELLYSTVNK